MNDQKEGGGGVSPQRLSAGQVSRISFAWPSQNLTRFVVPVYYLLACGSTRGKFLYS